MTPEDIKRAEEIVMLIHNCNRESFDSKNYGISYGIDRDRIAQALSEERERTKAENAEMLEKWELDKERLRRTSENLSDVCDQRDEANKKIQAIVIKDDVHLHTIASLEKQLSESKERTLNSEAVQGVVKRLEFYLSLMPGICQMTDEEYFKTLEGKISKESLQKFNQYRGEK